MASSPNNGRDARGSVARSPCWVVARFAERDANDDAERILTQIVNGVPKQDSDTVVDAQTSDLWDRMSASVACSSARGAEGRDATVLAHAKLGLLLSCDRCDDVASWRSGSWLLRP